ncbi:MAG: hypothetical protein K2I64_06695 [Muribaculaceae bacterium]|nr:hypothetical protein [Muribaculaceae bacterium]
MKKLIFPFLLILFLGGCRTTEANYRAAYEKAKAHRDSWNGIDGTVYDEIRRQSRPSTVMAAGVEIPAVTVRVKAVDGQSDEPLAGRYVVAAQFKQLFNARSLCRRLRDAGYDDACLLVTAEPLYYVAVGAPASDQELADIFLRLKSESPVALSDPYPMLLLPAK